MVSKNRVTSFLSRLRSRDVIGILARGTIIAFLVQIAGNGIGYAVQVLLARWLGAGGYGVYSYLITWAQVFSIGALLGLDLGLVRFIPEYLLRQDHARLCGILRWSRILVFAFGVLLAGISTLALVFVHPIRSEVISLVLCSLLIPLFALVEVQTQIIRSTRRIGLAYAPPILLQPLLLLGLAYAGLRILGGLTDYYSLVAMLISLGIIIVLQGGVIQRAFWKHSQNTVPIYETNGWLKVSLPLLFNSIFSIIALRVDLLAVGYYLGPEEVGIYSAAVRTAAIVGITLFAANTIVAPLIASYYARRDLAGLQDVVSLATMGAFWPALFIGAGVILFSKPLLGVFGAEFISARIPLILLVVGQLVNVGSGSVGLLMVLTGHERQSMFVVGVSALIISVACCFVVPSFGIIGAALVSMLGISLWNFWIYRMVVKNLGIHPSIFFALGKFIGGKG
jgi:O-antigen/teichoic acid export membrane protein